MRKIFILFFALFTASFALNAQTGCPGCQVNLPPNLPADTLYLPKLPDGEANKPYDESISFRMPKTTTPVNAVDSTTPPGLPISQIEVIAVEGLPTGLSWQPSQWIFDPSEQPDGCFRICGTPVEHDSFVLTVKLKATVFFIAQETSFPMRLYIAPPSSENEGFSMDDYIGCDQATVTFTNNNPSNGVPGFTYEWDFGDGTTFTGENPPPHTYAQPGLYKVSYNAVIDTVGYILVAAEVLEVDCTDPFGNKPDLYLKFKSPNGEVLLNSSPAINNTDLPHTFAINMPLGTGNYSIEVWDEDGGIKGTDDVCGTISFNYLSNDTLISGGFKVVLFIEKPITEIQALDTVLVYPSPTPPIVSTPNGMSACAGAEDLVLVSSYGGGNQWWFNGAPISGAGDFIYMPEQSGYYQVEVGTPYGCSSLSDSVLVTFYALPSTPVFINDRNNLELTDTTNLPDNYSLQWLDFNVPIPGATGFTYCATESGIYGLLVTDEDTGCTSSYAISVTHDPAYDCTISADEPAAPVFRLLPNPAGAWVRLEVGDATGDARVRVWDAAGRLMTEAQLPAGAGALTLDSSAWPAGLYTVELLTASGRTAERLAVMR